MAALEGLRTSALDRDGREPGKTVSIPPSRSSAPQTGFNKLSPIHYFINCHIYSGIKKNSPFNSTSPELHLPITV